ncbi:MAG: cytochrome C oxidase subunit IV family protein [Phycisphaeraceae bacterium]
MSEATAHEHHDADAHGHDGHDDHEHHVVSFKLLTVVFLALMVLTVLTVAAINVDLGPLNIVVALGIALVKALLVVLVFMHIWWDRAFHGLLIAASLGFVALFIGFTMIDTWQYEDTIQAYDAAQAKDAANRATDPYTPPPALMDKDPH